MFEHTHARTHKMCIRDRKHTFKPQTFEYDCWLLGSVRYARASISDLHEFLFSPHYMLTEPSNTICISLYLSGKCLFVFSETDTQWLYKESSIVCLFFVQLTHKYNMKYTILGFHCPWRVHYLTKYNYFTTDLEHKTLCSELVVR